MRMRVRFEDVGAGELPRQSWEGEVPFWKTGQVRLAIRLRGVFPGQFDVQFTADPLVMKVFVNHVEPAGLVRLLPPLPTSALPPFPANAPA